MQQLAERKDDHEDGDQQQMQQQQGIRRQGLNMEPHKPQEELLDRDDIDMNDKAHAQSRQAYADEEGENQVVRGSGDVADAIHQKAPGPETGETGSHRYQAGPEAADPSGAAERVDDVESYGADLAIELPWKMNLRLGYQERTISPSSGSNLPDQKISQIVANLGFGFSQGTWY